MPEQPLRQGNRLPPDIVVPADSRTVERNRKFDQILTIIRGIVQKMSAWERSDPSIQALAGRNAAVNINNTFGEQFRVLSHHQPDSISISNETDLNFIISGLHDIFELIDGQLPH